MNSGKSLHLELQEVLVWARWPKSLKKEKLGSFENSYLKFLHVEEKCL